MKSYISDYSIIEKLGESLHATVFKVCPKDQPDRLLVLKRIKPDIISEDISSTLKYQTDYLKDLKIQGLIKPLFYSFEKDESLLIREYFDGIPLDKWMRSHGKIGLTNFFKIACATAAVLEKMHNAGYIHRGIKPGNILIEPNTLDIRLIDPVKVIDINEISRYIYDDDFRIKTLFYISPEQTGRIKYLEDYTTDLYSLGIVLYELLNRAPPFQSEDPLEVVHSHIAETPVHLCVQNPDIPEMIGNIVARLILKEPEKRYQTDAGLLHDLTRSKDEYLKKGDISSFPLGLRDYSGRIRISSIMVGRDREKELLLEEHKLSCSGDFRSVMISGLPGIGKTRLIRELEISIIIERGYFTSGKFDQYQKNMPYSTLIQAFRKLIEVFLTEEADHIEYWKETIRGALESNGKLITDMIPELELIIGVQPEVADLQPTEAKNRFNDTMERFISCLAGSKHPLTLFIDDLQWCDSATFEILKNIFINSRDHPYLFLLGAYRNNEVDQGHPLSNLLERVREIKSPLKEIRINELEPVHTNILVSNILDVSTDQTHALTGFLNEKSKGNPLNTTEMLNWLFENNLIYPGKEDDWQWDTENIAKSPFPQSAEELFKSKILGIPKDSLTVLQVAACLGVQFRIEDLSMVTGTDHAYIYRKLASAFGHRVLIKRNGSLSFFHDRVQEAVVSTIDEKTRQTIHAHIAKIYIDAIPEGIAFESLENLFDIVTHLTKGKGALSHNNLLRDTKLYYSAGKKAFNALALEAANLYFRQGWELIGVKEWKEEYEFVYSFCKDLAMSELAIGNQDESQALLDTLLEKSKTDMDRAECLADQAANFSSLGKFQKAIDLSIQGLAYLGKSIPENEDDIDIRIDQLARVIKEVSTSTDEILGREILSNRRDIVEIALYNLLIPNTYLFGKVKRFFLAGLEAVNLSLFLGIHELSIYPYGIYMGFLIEQGDYEAAFIYEDLIIQLCHKFPNTFGAIRGMDCATWLSLHWRNHPSFILEFSMKSIEVGKTSCDTYYTGLAYCAAFWSATLQGNDLKSIENLISECEEYSIKYNLPFFSQGMAKGMRYAWIEPMKAHAISIDIAKDRDRWKESNDIELLGNYYIHSGMAEYYLGNYEVANQHLINGKDCLIGHAINIPNREWHIFYVLNSLRLSRESPSGEELNSVISEIEPILEKIELWASFGPALKPYLAFIQAELKAISGNFRETSKLYLDAIDSAHEEEYTLLEGHIHECLGELLQEHGINQAHFHISKAVNLYKKCHAQAKLKLIREKYPVDIPLIYKDKTEKEGHIQRLDAEYLMRATRAIYQELRISELLKVIMKQLMESSGASEGYLLLKKDADLITRVKGKKEKHIGITLTDELLSEETGFSRAMVRYVQRTKKALILENACEEGPYSKEFETMKLQLVSVFIHPIIRQQHLVGIICLQNNLIKAAFTQEQIEIVRQLSIHAVVAIENATLVEDMKKAQRIIEESEERYRGIITAAQDGIVILDKNGIILDANPAYCEMLGYSSDEVIGTQVENFVHIDHRHEVQDLFAAQIMEKGKIRMESVDTKKDGSPLPIEIHGIAFKHFGQDALLAVVRDITKQKSIQEELSRHRDHLETLVKERTERLDRANRELNDFAHIVSHDLKAPLRGITQLASWLAHDYADAFDEAGKEKINMLTSRARRMHGMIDGILQYSKIGRTLGNQTEVDLNLLVNEIVETISPPENIEITIANPLPNVYCDETAIYQVFQNLLDNAIKYMDKPKGRIFIDIESDCDNWRFFVSDNGSGIEERHREKIFQLFQTLVSKDETESTGIGLALVEKAVNNWGGIIWLESEVGKGSKFIFTVPKKGTRDEKHQTDTSH